MECQSSSTRTRSRALVAAAVFFSLSALLWIQSVGGIEAFRDAYGTTAPALSLLAHTLVNLTPLGEVLPLGVANGGLYGVMVGASLTLTASTLSSLVQYGIAHRSARELNLEWKRLPPWLAKLPGDASLFLIAARWFPAGGPVANAAAGVAGVSAWRLLCCALVGGTPPALLMAALGAGLIEFL